MGLQSLRGGRRLSTVAEARVTVARSESALLQGDRATARIESGEVVMRRTALGEGYPGTPGSSLSTEHRSVHRVVLELGRAAPARGFARTLRASSRQPGVNRRGGHRRLA